MAQTASGDPKRILIADDNEDFLVIIQQTLTARGYLLDVATTGEESLEKVRSFRPDLLILDLMMPGIHGIQVLQLIRENPATRNLPVIVCSATDYRPERHVSHTLGVLDFLSKPFLPSELCRRIDEFFQGALDTSQPAESPLREISASEIYLPHLTKPDVYIRFWGTRGSIPVSGRSYLVHGGDTSCVEVRLKDDLIIFDAGTGIRPLGSDLMKGWSGRVHLFVGHTHWDHIQGFPFFAPIYSPEFEMTVYGAPGFRKDLAAVFRGQLDTDYFPIQFDDLRAKIDFRTLDRTPIRIGEALITWEFVHHPGPAVGFKIDLGGKTVAYVSDNEFAKGYLGNPSRLIRGFPIVDACSRIIEFLEGVDVLIHEAQYSNQEYHSKISWGHSSLSNACALVRLAQVKQWLITHHDPSHTDEQLQEIQLLARQILDELSSSTSVRLAHDGLIEAPW